MLACAQTIFRATKMIKTIIFDLDGVLVNTKKIHYEALNKALNKIEKFKLSLSEHSKIFDGLPTQKKLEILLIVFNFRLIIYYSLFL